jgi:hypothetical protein
MGPDMVKKVIFVVLILGSLYMFVMSAFFIINDIIDAEITATINEKRAMEQEMEIERENLITGAEAYAKHAIGLDTLEETVHKKLNETETKILDATGLSVVLKKYNDVKSEIDHYSNAAQDAAVSTTVPPTATATTATPTAATTTAPVTATPGATTTTTVPAPVATTAVPAPVATTTVPAPVATTTVPAPVATTAVPAPVATTTVAAPTSTTSVTTAATPEVATTTEEVATVPTTETAPAAVEEAAPENPVTEAYMGRHRYDFEDEQDRLNQSTDGDELDEWFSKYSLLGNERERAHKLAELGEKRDAEQPSQRHQQSPHRKMLLPNPLENKRKTMY